LAWSWWISFVTFYGTVLPADALGDYRRRLCSSSLVRVCSDFCK